ncbi:MAG: DUF6782 family putative metallopeptidase [Pseudomonadota bacterium]
MAVADVSRDGQLNDERPLHYALSQSDALISTSRLGRHILKGADQAGIPTIFNSLRPEVAGQYEPDGSVMRINAACRLFMRQGNLASLVAVMSDIRVHELAHGVQHHRTKTPDQDMMDDHHHVLTPRQAMLYLAHVEAAASSAQCQVAWEAKQKGHDSLWTTLRKQKTEDPILDAFEQEARANPASVEDGRAQRAAHDAWFQTPSKTKYYGEAMVRKFAKSYASIDELAQSGKDADRVQAIAQYHQNQRAVDPRELRELGDFGGSANHLNVPGQRPLTDDYYRVDQHPDHAAAFAAIDQQRAQLIESHRAHASVGAGSKPADCTPGPTPDHAADRPQKRPAVALATP